MPTDFEVDAAQLILTSRWAAIATVEGGAPLASMVAYAPEPSLQGVLLFLSELSQHTTPFPRSRHDEENDDRGPAYFSLRFRLTITPALKLVSRFGRLRM